MIIVAGKLVESWYIRDIQVYIFKKKTDEQTKTFKGVRITEEKKKNKERTFWSKACIICLSFQGLCKLDQRLYRFSSTWEKVQV